MSESLENYFPITLKSDLWEPKVMSVHKIFLYLCFSIWLLETRVSTAVKSKALGTYCAQLFKWTLILMVTRIKTLHV